MQGSKLDLGTTKSATVFNLLTPKKLHVPSP